MCEEGMARFCTQDYK